MNNFADSINRQKLIVLKKILLLNLLGLSIPAFSVTEPLFEKIIISIPVDNFDNMGEVDIKIPVCKYDKDFAMTLTGDDALLGIYQRAFNFIRGKYIDDDPIFHQQAEKPTTGFTPERKLVYTDGCGNDIPFRLSVNWMACEAGRTMHQDGNIYTPQMWWSEAEHFTDFYNGIMNHGGVNDKTDPAYSIAYNFKETYDSLGIAPYILGVPGATTGFPEAGDMNDDIYFMESATFQQNGISINLESLTAGSILKSRFPRVCIDTKDHTYINEFINKRTDKPYWINLFCHDIKNSDIKVNGQLNADSCYNMLNYVYDNFGKGGKDNVWFASDAEITEYQYSRLNSSVERRIEDGRMIITVDAAYLPKFYFNELSLCIPGLISSDNIIISDNVITHSASSGEGNGMINFSFSDFTVDRSEKYLIKAQKNPSDENIENAMFFIERLRPELKEDFLKRLNQGLSIKKDFTDNDMISFDGKNIIVGESLKNIVYVYDIAGRVERTVEPKGYRQMISLPKGIYVLKGKKIVVP